MSIEDGSIEVSPQMLIHGLKFRLKWEFKNALHVWISYNGVRKKMPNTGVSEFTANIEAGKVKFYTIGKFFFRHPKLELEIREVKIDEPTAKIFNAPTLLKNNEGPKSITTQFHIVNKLALLSRKSKMIFTSKKFEIGDKSRFKQFENNEIIINKSKLDLNISNQ
jgi:hypothetical protein